MCEAKSVRIEQILERIQSEQYYQFPGTTLTVCCLTLTNGFNVTGESACVDMSFFDKKLGEDIAKANAIEKIWQLEGYLLKEKMHTCTCKKDN